MELYCFGFNGNAQFPDLSTTDGGDVSSHKILSPTKVLQCDTIDILWTSWCDSLLTTDAQHTDAEPTSQEGIAAWNSSPFTSSQKTKLKDLLDNGANVVFGRSLNDGMKGIIKTSEPSSINFFASEKDIEDGEAEVQTFVFVSDDPRLRQVSIASSGQVYALSGMGEESSSILPFASLTELKKCLRDPTESPPEPLLPPSPELTWKSIVSNATTMTALSTSGQVYTWTTDRRFPACLGREATADAPAHIPSPIPYLSETRITKVASGGYMTAALSSDGELFLWGQACPGTEGELNVLKPKEESKDTKVNDDDLFIPDPSMDLYLPPPPPGYRPWSYRMEQRWAREVAVMRRDGRLPKHPDDDRPGRQASTNDDDQDDFVKCVEINVPGSNNPFRHLATHGTRVVDVAVGHGHILAAVEAGESRAVFAAGEGESGQLGLGEAAKFQSGFTEISGLRGKKVKSMAAAGWSSWVVVET